MAGRIFAYRANDGTKIWETPAEERMLEEKAKHLKKSTVLQASARYGWGQSLIVAEEMLIVPRGSTLRGLDP